MHLKWALFGSWPLVDLLWVLRGAVRRPQRQRAHLARLSFTLSVSARRRSSLHHHSFPPQTRHDALFIQAERRRVNKQQKSAASDYISQTRLDARLLHVLEVVLEKIVAMPVHIPRPRSSMQLKHCERISSSVRSNMFQLLLKGSVFPHEAPSNSVPSRSRWT